MKIEKNSRQMPSTSYIVKEKEYCDLLYAWVQCNSEKAGDKRRIGKDQVKWVSIERDFTRVGSDGKSKKVMSRKTIAKYFKCLEDKGLIKLEEDGYYYLTVLGADEAMLIEFNTLAKMMNVFQRNSINIYIYLFNRYYAAGQQPFVATMKNIKDFIGIATSTTSNNLIVDDTIDILKRLGLLDYEIKTVDNKTMFEFKWVKNKLPD